MMIPLHLPFNLPLLLFIIFQSLLMIWGCRDAAKSSMPFTYKFWSMVLMVLTGIIGFMIYLFILRSKFEKEEDSQNFKI